MIQRAVLLVCLLMMARWVLAQEDETDSAHLLYRSEGRLFLADAATGETIELPDTDSLACDQWAWSPDGRYLAAMRWSDCASGNAETAVFGVYDVEQFVWLHQQTVDATPFTASYAAVWSADSQHLVYAANLLNLRGKLWLFTLETGEHQLLYESPEGAHNLGTMVGTAWWSPDNRHLLFISAYILLGDEALTCLVADTTTGRLPTC